MTKELLTYLQTHWWLVMLSSLMLWLFMWRLPAKTRRIADTVFVSLVMLWIIYSMIESMAWDLFLVLIENRR